MMFRNEQLTKEQALVKIKHYCSYQERCHQEVKDKLYSYKLRRAEVEQLIAQLIEDDYLNEERFAMQYAGGKFRIKHWGKVKITHELRQKNVSTYCIKSALKEISENDYIMSLKKLATLKLKSLAKQSLLEKKSKAYTYLLSKGYESALIQKVLEELEG